MYCMFICISRAGLINLRYTENFLGTRHSFPTYFIYFVRPASLYCEECVCVCVCVCTIFDYVGNILQSFIQHPALKVNSICEGNYRRSSLWLSTQQVDYWSYSAFAKYLRKRGNTIKKFVTL